jgi:hypothetical protein
MYRCDKADLKHSVCNLIKVNATAMAPNFEPSYCICLHITVFRCDNEFDIVVL